MLDSALVRLVMCLRLPVRIAGAAGLSLSLAASVLAQGQGTSPPGNQPVNSLPDPPQCLSEAATFHQVNPWILRAIIWHESHNRADLVMTNHDGSIDVGAAGINSSNFADLAKYHVAPANLLNPCVATYVAAWHLAKQMRVYGNSWAAVGAYNSRNPANGIPYARKIQDVLRQWHVLSQP